ncbi:hypothetical protein ACLEE6_11740 [Lonsdalea quercina]|uniref:hypothetical protein n=1 Tax=Lonsdalea quercina TaxID=71657 RepID=UPI0039762E85
MTQADAQSNILVFEYGIKGNLGGCMEITSIVSFYKLFIPVLPIVKKIFFFESFFSLSNEKKAEAITYLSDCVDEREPLRKYNQEIKLSG